MLAFSARHSVIRVLTLHSSVLSSTGQFGPPLDLYFSTSFCGRLRRVLYFYSFHRPRSGGFPAKFAESAGFETGKESNMIRKASVALTLVCTLLFACTARAQELTKDEKDRALAYLETSRKDVLDAAKDLSPAQWNFKPSPDRWSIAECMEHIAAAEDYIRGMIESGVMKAPAAPGRDTAAIDAGIIANVPARKNKVQAPDEIKPINRYGSPQNSIAHFLESRSKTEEFLRSTP